MKLGVLFDLDGTLLDTLEDLTDATNYALRVYGCPSRSLEQVRQVVGNGAQNQIRLSLPGKADDPDLMAVLATYKEYYNTHCQIKTKPYDGVMEALEQLEKKYPLAIVSNKPDPTVKQLCAQYFPGIYTQGESADCPKKPAPDMVWQTMKAIGVDTCIFVGDSEVDIATARNAGVSCLSVLWGFRDQDVLEEAGASDFCANPGDIPAKIEAMEGKYGK